LASRIRSAYRSIEDILDAEQHAVQRAALVVLIARSRLPDRTARARDFLAARLAFDDESAI